MNLQGTTKLQHLIQNGQDTNPPLVVIENCVCCLPPPLDDNNLSGLEIFFETSVLGCTKGEYCFPLDSHFFQSKHVQ